MRGTLALAVALASILLASISFSSFSLLAAADSGLVIPQQTISLRAGYFQFVEIDSFSNNTHIVYNATSDNPISIAFMNSSQLGSFRYGQNDPISNSIIYTNGTVFNQEVNVSPGRYYLVFYAYAFGAIVNYGYLVYPNTPFSYGALQPLQPTGIASFGINNDSGYATTYEIMSNEVAGIANISSLLADNPNAPSYGDNVAGATLQLNINLVIQRSNGRTNVYWVQNTPDFVTSVNTVALTDNIWNNSDMIGRLTNESVTSSNSANGGAVYTSVSRDQTTYAYIFDENNMTYKLPFSFALVANESVLKGEGVLVQLGYRLFQNGSLVKTSTYWYDNITIHEPEVTSAYFEVSGNATTPVANFYDAELVFAGEGNLEPTQFVNMSASLGLFYKNATTGDFVAYPSYYSFGGDTGETAGGVNIGYTNGIAYLKVGSSNYVYLGNASLNLGQDYQPHSLFSIPNSSIAASTTSSTGSSNPNLTTVYFAIGILVIVILGLAYLFRRKPTKSTAPQPYIIFPSQLICAVCGADLPNEALYCSNCGAPQR